jgi:hypothetical protein
MADTLVERVTGQAKAADVNVELQIAMPLDALLDANNHAADLDGYGPLPADLARDLLATSKGRLWWRRLYAGPVGGPLVGGDPHRRHFDGYVRKLIMWRDRRCRDPFCDAPIRHIDHIQRYSDGGPDRLSQRSRGVRTRQLCPRDAWLEGRSCLWRVGRPTPHNQDHHPNRSYLSEPRAVDRFATANRSVVPGGDPERRRAAGTVDDADQARSRL